MLPISLKHLGLALAVLTGTIVIFARAMTAVAGSDGQHITAVNGHAQSGICLSGYNQNEYWMSGVCTWLNNTQAGQSNGLAASYWWKTYNGINVYLDSYTNYPFDPNYIGTTQCYVPESWWSDWYTCQAY